MYKGEYWWTVSNLKVQIFNSLLHKFAVVKCSCSICSVFPNVSLWIVTDICRMEYVFSVPIHISLTIMVSYPTASARHLGQINEASKMYKMWLQYILYQHSVLRTIKRFSDVNCSWCICSALLKQSLWIVTDTSRIEYVFSVPLHISSESMVSYPFGFR